MKHWQYEEGTKHDGDKIRVDLVDPLFIESTANGMAYGVTKYGANNWRKGLKQSRVYGAALRHLFAYWMGTDIDEESGNHHLDHAACMLMMLIRFAKDKGYRELDDRPYSTLRKEHEEYQVACEQRVCTFHPNCEDANLPDGMGCPDCQPDLTPSDSEPVGDPYSKFSD